MADRQGAHMPYQEDPKQHISRRKAACFWGGRAELSVSTEWSCWKEAEPVMKPPFADGLQVSRKLGKGCRCLQWSPPAKRMGWLGWVCCPPAPATDPAVLTGQITRQGCFRLRILVTVSVRNCVASEHAAQGNIWPDQPVWDELIPRFQMEPGSTVAHAIRRQIHVFFKEWVHFGALWKRSSSWRSICRNFPKSGEELSSFESPDNFHCFLCFFTDKGTGLIKTTEH